MSAKLSRNLKAEEVINLDDFKSLRLDLIFTNGSGVAFNQGVVFNEIGEKEIMLQVPGKSCAADQNVMLVVYKDQKERHSKPILSITGKISSWAMVEDGNIRITIQLVQYEEKEWDRFLALFSSRQNEINAFLESMRS